MKFDEPNQEHPMKANVDPELIKTIMSVAPQYANKFFFSIQDNTVKITFAEENQLTNHYVVRNSTVLSIGGFMSLMGMLIPQMEQIQAEFKKQMENVVGKENIQ